LLLGRDNDAEDVGDKHDAEGKRDALSGLFLATLGKNAILGF